MPRAGAWGELVKQYSEFISFPIKPVLGARREREGEGATIPGSRDNLEIELYPFAGTD